MPYTVIAIKDFGDLSRDVKTNLRGTTHTQVLELESVTPYVNLDLDETGVMVLAAIAQLHSWQIFNRGVLTLYVKVYDKATAATGSDTPKIVWEVLPGQPAPYSDSVENGIAFALGISLRCTTGIAHADTGAPGANDCLINLGYRAG